VLLDVEVPIGVDPADGQDVGNEDTERVREQLSYQGHNVDTGVSQAEELVDTGADEDEDL
jgi:hypothetical protein